MGKKVFCLLLAVVWILGGAAACKKGADKPPGGKIELSIIASDDKAVSGNWIIKEVVYEKPNPVDKTYGSLPYKWTNPNFEAELEAEKTK